MPLTLGAAIALGLRSLTRESWLAAVGLLVAVARRALALPAVLVASLLLARGAAAAAKAFPLHPAAPVAGALLAVASPRGLAVVLGLWASGALLGAALRLAWLSGALPTLAAAMGRAPDGAPRFAAGVARLLPRLLPVALLGLALELAGGGFALVLALAAGRVGAGAVAGGPAWLLAPVAAGLVLALAAPVALSLLADAAMVRAAVRGEGPGEAFASAARRLLARPAAYALAALAFGALGLAAAGGVHGAGQAATGFAVGVAPGLLAGPQLMIAAAAAWVAAVVELWWWASLTALATHEG